MASSLILTGATPAVLRADDVQVRWVMPENFYGIPIDAMAELFDAVAGSLKWMG
ncbi:hypothetical protein [Streptomyces sp. NPDC059781]|uniref:hypothetical protein n=1 Tax=Streptomyces sp. NPDC059781 TaxID=3346943 RepID=UPI00366A4FD1